MEEFLKKIEKEYGIDEESFKKLVIIGAIALILAGIGIFWLIDSMQVKTLPYDELKAKVETLWEQAKSKGAESEADYRKYILDRLTLVNYRQYILDITTEGVNIIDKVANLNKYGFFFDVGYYIDIPTEEGYSRYVMVFHEDGSADIYSSTAETLYYTMCDIIQNEKNLKYETRAVKLTDYELQFSEDGFDVTITRIPTEEMSEEEIANLPKYVATVTYDEIHGIFKEYTYVGNIEDIPSIVKLGANGKFYIAQEAGNKEFQVRTDTDGHRIIYEGGVYGTLSMDGRTLMIGEGVLSISETPYTYNVEEPKYPGMKVKLMEGSTVETLKAGKPKTGDIIIYNDYMYVCNKRYEKDTWVVFNEDEANPEWGVRIIGDEYQLVADMEDEIFGVPVTMLYYTFADCLMLAHPPKLSVNAKEMVYTFSTCAVLRYAPKIPTNVVDMTGAFSGCAQMKTSSTLPTNVVKLTRTFEKCSELTTLVKIPENVTNISYIYEGCKALTGVLKIDSNKIEAYDSCFAGTGDLILTGKCAEETLRAFADGSGKHVKLATDPEVDTGDGFTEINQ